MHSWPTTDCFKRYAGVPDLAIALDDATGHVRPVRLTRLFPAHSLRGGDFTFGLGSPNIVGAGLGGGKLSSPLGEDGVILSLPPTL